MKTILCLLAAVCAINAMSLPDNAQLQEAIAGLVELEVSSLFIITFHIYSLIFIGFPPPPPAGGGGGVEHTMLPNFSKNCMKSRKKWAIGAPPPLGSTNA